MKKLYCSKLKPGTPLVKDIFAIKECLDGKTFSFFLSDRSGSIEAVLVDSNITDIELIRSNIGGVFEITGVVLAVPGETGLVNQVKVKSFSVTNSYVPSEIFNGISSEVRDFHIREIRRALEKLKAEDTDYYILASSLLTDENLMKLSLYPASHTFYGTYVGGALVATSALPWMAVSAASSYGKRGNGITSSLQGMEWSLLLAGGLLHQVGKLRFYDEENPFQKSSEGVALNYYSTLLIMIEDILHEKNIQIDPLKKGKLLNCLNVTVSERTDTKAVTKEATILRSMARIYRECEGVELCCANHTWLEGEQYYYDDKLERYISVPKEVKKIEEKGER